MGMQFVTMGLLGELLVRTYHESQGKPVYRVAGVVSKT
jgi:dolichol-phosphate mannosyltransferase